MVVSSLGELERAPHKRVHRYVRHPRAAREIVQEFAIQQLLDMFKLNLEALSCRAKSSIACAGVTPVCLYTCINDSVEKTVEEADEYSGQSEDAEASVNYYYLLLLLLLLYTPTRRAVDNTQIQLICNFKRERGRKSLRRVDIQ